MGMPLGKLFYWEYLRHNKKEKAMEQKEPKSSDVLAQERTDLAAERNIMAADRTLMAWIRTAIAMIGVGFTIYGFFHYLQAAGGALTFNQEGPRRLGLFLIGLGTISVLLGIKEYWTSMKRISKKYKTTPWRSTLITACLIGAFGLLLIISIILNLEIL